jgi:outer membrane biosynthesis protein TonB
MSAWHESLPAIEKPPRTDSILALEFEYNQVDLSFNISRRGAVSSVDVLEASPDERRVRTKAARALRDVQFRPAIFDGKTKRVRDVQIRYLSLPE